MTAADRIAELDAWIAKEPAGLFRAQLQNERAALIAYGGTVDGPTGEIIPIESAALEASHAEE